MASHWAFKNVETLSQLRSVIQDDSNLSEAIYSLIYRGNAHVITRASVFILKIPSPGGIKLVKDMLRGLVLVFQPHEDG